MSTHHTNCVYKGQVQEQWGTSCGCRCVCDFTYCLSLNLGDGHAALIHVPPLSPWLPASLLGKALQVIIQEMLEESEVQTQKYNSRREAAGGWLL